MYYRLVTSKDKPNKVFVIMQVGDKDSAERKRANEVLKYVITPVLTAHGLEPLRGDLDPTPGPITSQMIKTLIESPVVIADLTGKNPNVYYELGVAQSFGLPVVILCDSTANLAFDTKDERTILLGDSTNRLSAEQAEEAKELLEKALKKALEPGYRPTTVVSEAAAARSLDQLAPKNPELTAIRDGIDELRTMTRQVYLSASRSSHADISALRSLIEKLVEERRISPSHLWQMQSKGTSTEFAKWVEDLRQKLKPPDDPWADESSPAGYSDEPPF